MELHRLFGLALTDYFSDSSYRVDVERDLSLKKQLLDVVIIEQEADGQVPELPDGLENLGRHNLLTYKSLHQTLDSWVLDELVGHYVNYRKQTSPSHEKLLPAEDFRLYAVCTRQPEKLATEVPLTSLKQGVYETLWGTHRIRIIVLSQVPEIERNAMWQLFSGIAEKVQYGFLHYHWRRDDHSTVIEQLYQRYRVEGIAMSYTWDDFYRDFTKENLDKLTAEERLKGLPVEERLKGLPVEERLKGLPVEEWLKGLPVEARLKGLPVEARLKGLSAKEIEAYLKKLRTRRRKRK
ncbi:MAG: hypothetical protein ACREOI_25585 [bacterium]